MLTFIESLFCFICYTEIFWRFLSFLFFSFFSNKKDLFKREAVFADRLVTKKNINRHYMPTHPSTHTHTHTHTNTHAHTHTHTHTHIYIYIYFPGKHKKGINPYDTFTNRCSLLYRTSGGLYLFPTWFDLFILRFFSFFFFCNPFFVHRSSFSSDIQPTICHFDKTVLILLNISYDSVTVIWSMSFFPEISLISFFFFFFSVFFFVFSHIEFPNEL